MHLRFFTLMFLFRIGNALIAYDCNAYDSKFTAVSLVTEPTCKRSVENVVELPASIQVLQTKKFDSVPYIQCLVIYDVTVTHCGSWMQDNLLAAQYSHVMELSREKCNEMHHHLSYSDLQFPGIHVAIKNGRGDFSGFVVGNNDDGDCQGATFHSHKRNIGVLNKVAVHMQMSIKIKTGMASLQLKEQKLILESGYSAKYQSLKSFEPENGYSFWETIISKDNCAAQQVFIVYQGRAKKLVESLPHNEKRTTYVVNDVGQERDFLIETKGNTSVCGEIAFMTLSVNLFVVESSNGAFQNKLQKNSNPRNIDANLMTSMKISHLAHDVGRQISELYADLMFEKCLTDTRVVLNMLALAKVDPVDFGFLFFKEPGYLGSVRSEVIYLQQCLPVNVTHRETMECFNELPVTFNNEDYFMSPRSRILVKVGTQVQCSNILHNMYRLNNEWFMRMKGGVLIQGTPPSEVSLKPATEWLYRPLNNVDGGLYSTEQMDSLNKVVFTPLTQSAEVVNYINTINGNFERLEGNLDPSRAFSLKDLMALRKKLQQSLWEHFKSFATSIGDVTSFVIGTFLIFKGVKFIANTIINGYIIGYAFGFLNYRILFSCWSNVVSLFLHRNTSKRFEAAFKAEEGDVQQEDGDDKMFNKMTSYAIYPTLKTASDDPSAPRDFERK